ncbi:sulfite exporter TauE/SafE family protein [Clostridium thermarum]|uniref:urease accessory protein UreH domain-containing protein n=1 Tax=Clostridium thermarum TaxID=1716543 RepID=UPI001120538B|nr:sulfite exporter TauE/SafE family protein [Clostridium thermarum]
MGIRRDKIKVYEMTCTSCENRVERAIKSLDGVVNAMANYSGEFAVVEYDDEFCDLDKIKEAVRKAGYSVQSSNDYKFIGILIAVAAVVLLGLKTSGFDMEEKLSNASYAVLFVVGVLTSIHCVGMCGGIMLSQSLSKESTSRLEAMMPAFQYNLGRVVSYTLLGGLVGALGSVFSLSIAAKAALQIFAGAFMLVMGFNMAGFKVFRKFSIKLPHSVCKVKNSSNSSFVVGLFNGLMPCGPLQTMQLFALGTGSAIKGALSMFMFSIGTVPLMLTFGALSGLLSKGYTKKILKLSGVLIIFLGIIMGNRGFTLMGINLNPFKAIANSSKDLLNGNSTDSLNSNVAKATIKDGVQEIVMTAGNGGYMPNAFYVQKGIPVRWIIKGEKLNSCNNAIIVPSLNLELKLKKGENVVKEFIPGDKDINFSCWMGMITGVIKVVDKLDTVDTSVEDPSIPPASSVPGCCSVPLEEEDEPASTSIYGNDLTIIPTTVLVNKATVTEKEQAAQFNGYGNVFQPLIVVTGSSNKTKLTFDLSAFDVVDGEYVIADVLTGEKVATFIGKNGINEVEFNAPKAGGYGIWYGDYLLGVIEVVNDLESVDLEDIRNTYIN